MSKIRLLVNSRIKYFRDEMGISRKKLSVARNDLIWFSKIIGESNVKKTPKSDKEGRYLC